ncbi:MAG: hypothetical protein HGA45_23675 [Chloroflexales bacterium]|nr:hypothetical protein [Chloroflexales bacterium]
MAELQLTLLGGLRLAYGDDPLADLSSAKARALLCYLAVTGRPHSRQALAGLLWGELLEEDARRNLRVVLMRLRERLAPHLSVTRETIAFDRASPYRLDTEQFQRALHAAQGAADPAPLQRAVELYQGEFLEDFHLRDAPFFDEWVVATRERLRQQVLDTLQRLVVYHTDRAEHGRGLAYARRLLAFDPWREEAHRQLMLLLALAGQRSAALAQFEICRRVLAEQFEVEPAPETVALYRRIGVESLATASAPAAQPAAPPPAAELPPFLAGPPVLHPRHFFGRERELGRIFGLLRRAPLQNAAIVGRRRAGKTSLLHHLRTICTAPSSQLRPGQRTDWLPEPGRYRWAFIDFQNPRLGTRAGLLRSLLGQLGLPQPTPCDLDGFMEAVDGGLHGPTVILLDEIEVALQRYHELDDGFWEGMRSLATSQTAGQLAFVLASSAAPETLAARGGLSSPFFNIFGYTTTLGPLSEPEARALVACAPIVFADVDIEWILARSESWPLLLQILCRERLAALEAGETGEEWRAEGLRQLSPFRHLLEAP